MNFWAYVGTFHITSWVSILCLILVLSVAYTIIPMLGIELLHFDSDSEKFRFTNAIALVALIFVKKGYPISKTLLVSRVLHGFTCFAGFMVFTYYSAVLFSLMTSKPPPIPIHSFEDVLDLGKRVIVWEATSNEALLK